MTEKADSLSLKFRDIFELSASGTTGIVALMFVVLVISLIAIGFALGRHRKMW